ncbi:hypothetical protein L1049_027332 [Liquidambar formosana]|uniref:Secreted protein n=1 Tax=Liquidambar formosana TaxID=63359 RepID=A0AAP0R2F4_LIQFO
MFILVLFHTIHVWFGSLAHQAPSLPHQRRTLIEVMVLRLTGLSVSGFPKLLESMVLSDGLSSTIDWSLRNQDKPISGVSSLQPRVFCCSNHEDRNHLFF